MKKDFSKLNTAPLFDTIAEATAEADDAPATEPRKERRTYSKKETELFVSESRTQGRKGLKSARINLAFEPEVYDYVKTMARVRGESLTAFVNYILRESLEDNRDVYEKALEFRNSL